MKTLSTPIDTERQATQSGWAELIDIYLPSAITTPFGTTDTLRLNSSGVDLAFFTPSADPEPTATQGNAQTYSSWPLKRTNTQAKAQSANDKVTLTASNVTAEWATMLDAIDWQDAPVLIRKISLSIASPVADDAVVLFSGKVDAFRTSDREIALTCSSDLGTFTHRLPAEPMHPECRFRFADDMCTALKYSSDNFAHKTAAAGCTTTRLFATAAGQTAASVTVDAATDTLTLTSHGLSNGHRVRLAATTMPGGLTAGRWYHVVNKTTNTLQLAATHGGSAIDITSAGTAVTLTSERGCYEDTAQYPFKDDTVTIDTAADTVGIINAHQAGDRVRFSATTMPGGLTAGVWYHIINPTGTTFQVAATAGGSAIDLTTTGAAVKITTTSPYGADLIDALSNSAITASEEVSTAIPKPVTATPGPPSTINHTAHGLSNWDYVRFTADTMPAGLVAGQTYYAYDITANTYRLINQYGAYVNFTTAGTNLQVTAHPGFESGGSDNEAYRVKSTYDQEWRWSSDTQWGTVTQGYWRIPDAQAGLQNSSLTPWIQFDLGSAKAPRTWRLKAVADLDRQQIFRLIQFHAADDAAFTTGVEFVGHHQFPPAAGVLQDVHFPNPPSKRYWRICIRSLWGEQIHKQGFAEVRAHLTGRNYWRAGRVQFAADTATTALQGVSARVRASYSGVLDIEALPVAPAAGDRFQLLRGCPRTFNACAERGNTENYGGFETLPYTSIPK